MPLVADLFLTFFKIGLFTFGGGYAMISLIEDECVVKKKWISHDEMMNLTVIAESTPGPIAINCATFVGYKQAGFLGAICSTLGVVVPSFVIILLISLFLDDFLEIEIIAKAFAGIRIAVGILIVNASLNMIKKSKKKDYLFIVVFCLLMLAINIFSLNISSIVLMLMAALVSLALFVAKEGLK